MGFAQNKNLLFQKSGNRNWNVRAWNNCLGMNVPLASGVCRGRKKMTCKTGKMSSGQNLPTLNVSLMFFKARDLKTSPSTREGTCRVLSVCWSRHQILLICLQFSVTSLCKLWGLNSCLGYQNTFFCIFCLFFFFFSIPSVWKLGCEA